MGSEHKPGAPQKKDEGAVLLEVGNTLQVMAGARLHRLLPGLVLVYAALSLKALASYTDESAIFAWLACSTCAICGVAWILGRHKRLAPRFVHPLAAFVGLLILAQSLLNFYLTSDFTQVAIAVLVLLGGAATLLSLGWFMFMVVPALAGWIVFATQKLPMASRVNVSVGLVAAAGLSVLAVWMRHRKRHQAAEAQLRVLEAQRDEHLKRARLDLAVEGTQDGLWYWDLKSNHLHFSEAWGALLGYEKGELKTDVEEWFDRVHPGYIAELRTELSSHLYGKTDQFQHQHRLRRRDGTYVWVMARGKAIRDSSGEALALAGSHRDISSLIGVEQRLLTDSFNDKLTGLPNRAFLLSRLELAMERKKRSAGASVFALMFLDLDRFKVINDSMGHMVGDHLLAAVANRLRNCARPGDVVARFGGDEFVILMEPVRGAEDALKVGLRIREVLSAPFHIEGREVTSGASVGIALSDENVQRTEDILRYADIAMYQAKSQGKGDVRVFNQDMSAQATKLCDLQNDLARALDRQELVLHYQPYISIVSKQMCGVEALIRWKRAGGELLLPDDFIPLAEETGLINEIGEWALRTACEQNSAWQSAGLPPMRVAVNLSPQQLQQKEFPQTVRRILDETGLDARWLELELTESALMDSLDRAPGTFEELYARGIRMSLDDFGTGYSSLNYLRRFNFQSLKMDRCFVSDIATDRKAAAVARGVISLAHNLDLSVTAEGVERNDQLAFLVAEKCDLVQGFLASRPLPPAQLASLLNGGAQMRRFSHSLESAGRTPIAERDSITAEEILR